MLAIFVKATPAFRNDFHELRLQQQRIVSLFFCLALSMTLHGLLARMIHRRFVLQNEFYEIA